MTCATCIIRLTTAMTSRHETRRRLFFAFVHLIGLFIVYRLSADFLADIACRSGGRSALEIASSGAPGNARVLYELALKSHYSLASPGLDKAIGLYRRAVGRDPFYAPAWYQMALACRLAGKNRDADAAISRYEMLRNSYEADLWNIGIFRLEAGEEDQAAACFRRCIELSPDSEAGVAGLFLIMNTPQNYMVQKVLPRTTEAYSGYMDYLLGSGMANEALSFFRLSQGLVSADRSASLCRLLISGGRYDEAWDFWRRFLGGAGSTGIGGMADGGTVIINGGFEGPLEEREETCFGWMARQERGFDFSYDGNIRTGGKRSLHIRFDGSRGPGLWLWQYIRVVPNRSYELKADIRTRGIKTASGIYLEVRSRACGGYHERSAALRGTGDWRKLSLAFRAPDGCRLLKAGIARDSALKLDQPAPSDAWVDDIRISVLPPGSGTGKTKMFKEEKKL